MRAKSPATLQVFQTQIVGDFALFLQKCCPSPWADCAQPGVSWHDNWLWFYINSLLVAVAKTECKSSSSWPCPWLCMSLLAGRRLMDIVFENVPPIFWQCTVHIATWQYPVPLKYMSLLMSSVSCVGSLVWGRAGNLTLPSQHSAFIIYFFFNSIWVATPSYIMCSWKCIQVWAGWTWSPELESVLLTTK